MISLLRSLFQHVRQVYAQNNIRERVLSDRIWNYFFDTFDQSGLRVDCELCLSVQLAFFSVVALLFAAEFRLHERKTQQHLLRVFVCKSCRVVDGRVVTKLDDFFAFVRLRHDDERLVDQERLFDDVLFDQLSLVFGFFGDQVVDRPLDETSDVDLASENLFDEQLVDGVLERRVNRDDFLRVVLGDLFGRADPDFGLDQVCKLSGQFVRLLVARVLWYLDVFERRKRISISFAFLDCVEKQKQQLFSDFFAFESVRMQLRLLVFEPDFSSFILDEVDERLRSAFALFLRVLAALGRVKVIWVALLAQRLHEWLLAHRISKLSVGFVVSFAADVRSVESDRWVLDVAAALAARSHRTAQESRDVVQFAALARSLEQRVVDVQDLASHTVRLESWIQFTRRDHFVLAVEVHVRRHFDAFESVLYCVFVVLFNVVVIKHDLDSAGDGFEVFFFDVEVLYDFIVGVVF